MSEREVCISFFTFDVSMLTGNRKSPTSHGRICSVDDGGSRVVAEISSSEMRWYTNTEIERDNIVEENYENIAGKIS
jgi:hypothetical protein